METIGGFCIEHSVVEECDCLNGCLELETPTGQKKIIKKELSYKKSKVTPISKTTESWSSKPIMGRFLTATSAAYSAASPARRLSFSSCLDLDDEENKENVGPNSQDSIHNTINNIQPSVQYDDDVDLKLENIELKNQNKKQVDDLRDAVERLHDAEDKNQALEVKLSRVQRELRNCIERYEKLIEEYKSEIEQQSEVSEGTKERLKDKSDALHKLQKEYQDLQLQQTSTQKQLEKSSFDLSRLQILNSELNDEMKKASTFYETQIKEFSEKCLKFETENFILKNSFQELTVSYQNIEREKHELESLTMNRPDTAISSLFSASLSNVSEESDEENITTFEHSFNPGFPPSHIDQSASIFAEIQSALAQSPFEVNKNLSNVNAMTQTDEPVTLPEVNEKSKDPISILPLPNNKSSIPQNKEGFLKRLRRWIWPYGFISWILATIGLFILLGMKLNPKNYCNGGGVMDIDSIVEYSVQNPRI